MQSHVTVTVAVGRSNGSDIAEKVLAFAVCSSLFCSDISEAFYFSEN